MSNRGWVVLSALSAALALLCSCAGSKSSTSSIGDPVITSAPPSLDQLNVLLQAEFERLGVDPARAVAKAPDGAASAVLDLQLTNVDIDGPGLGSELPSAIKLMWTERFPGDFNQDGVVSVQDLAPIGQNFLRRVSYDAASLHGGIENWPSGDPAALGAPNWRLARVDGIADGIISVNDLTAIGLHFGERMDGYVIRRGVNRGNGSIEWDSEALDIGAGTLPSLARAGFSAAAGEPFRYSVEIPLAEAQFNHYFSIQACDSASGTFGLESAAVVYSPNPGVDTEAPVWTSTVGVTHLTPGDQLLTVCFGEASDAQSPPVSYRVYYAKSDPDQPQAPFDYGTATLLTASASPVTINGLTNDDYWRVVVRAVDSADVPNEEGNSVVLGAKIGAADVYPPEWQGSAGLLDLYYGNGQALLVGNTAVDSQQDQHGLWESTPVIYRVYHGEGSNPDFNLAQIADFTDRGLEQCVLPLAGIDTSKDHWFCLRARDSAEQPNEDNNAVFLFGRGTSSQSWVAPLAGPGVPNGAEASGPPSFAYSPALGSHRLVTQLTVSGSHWASAWQLGPLGYVPSSDIYLCSDSEAPDFSLQGSALDSGGKLRLLYVKESVFSDHFTISEFRQATGDSNDYTLTGDYEVNACGYNYHSEPFCLFDAFDTSVASGQTSFEFYMSALPLTTANQIYDTKTGSSPQVVNFWDWGYSRLGDGRIGLMLRITDYISGAESYKLLSCSTTTHTSQDYQLQADRLVAMSGNGVAKPLIITELSGPQGKTQQLGDGQITLNIGGQAGMRLERSQIEAASTGSFAAMLELETNSYYGAQPDVKLVCALLHDESGDYKVPLLLEPEATSFKPLAVLDGPAFLFSYYLPADGASGSGERHLLLRFTQP